MFRIEFFGKLIWIRESDHKTKQSAKNRLAELQSPLSPRNTERFRTVTIVDGIHRVNVRNHPVQVQPPKPMRTSTGKRTKPARLVGNTNVKHRCDTRSVTPLSEQCYDFPGPSDRHTELP